MRLCRNPSSRGVLGFLGSGALALGIVLGLPSQLRADPLTLSIATPDFLIPLAGQEGTLTVYSDGTAPTTTGFNALGTQTFSLAGGGATSTGTLILNLVFSGFPLGNPTLVITAALLELMVNDFDFVTDQVTQTITLKEMAVLDSVNGAPLVDPFDLKDYLPPGADTDDELVALQPINLMGPLTSTDFTNPFVLSFTLTAKAKNTGTSAVNLVNTPEALIANVALKLTTGVAPSSVPEPSTTAMLIVSGLAGLLYRRRAIGD
jgi:hypothetical protein